MILEIILKFFGHFTFDIFAWPYVGSIVLQVSTKFRNSLCSGSAFFREKTGQE